MADAAWLARAATTGATRESAFSAEEWRPTMSQVAMTPHPIARRSRESAARHDARKSAKTIVEPIWGHIRVPGYAVGAMDTPQFQRMRELKQLGTTYYVFPGASHNRFEHSLGVAHKANEVAERIYSMQHNELGMTRRDVELVTLAGLVHDIGHGPFSHVFDHEFLPALRLPEDTPGTEHEYRAGMMLDALVDENHLDWEEGDADRIKELVMSSCAGVKPMTHGKRFLQEIVANGRNGLDVDKYDYLKRDSYYTGVSCACDYTRLMNFIKVIDDEISWKESEANSIYELYASRSSLHRRVYTHPKGKAVEFMVVDALLEAEPVLQLKNTINNAELFTYLDDTILKRIEFDCFGSRATTAGRASTSAPVPAWENAAAVGGGAGSAPPHFSQSLGGAEALAFGNDAACRLEMGGNGLEKAQALLKRLRKRQLYRYVNEFVVPQEMLPRFKPVKAEDITTCQSAGDGVTLTPDMIRVHNVKIDYTKKDRDPVTMCSFFTDFEDETSFKRDPEKVSSMLPRNFQERRVRVFSVDPDLRVVAAVERAFAQFQRRLLGSVHSTPSKSRQDPSHDGTPDPKRMRSGALSGDNASLSVR